ncbi:MAG: hypothetical protein KDD54_06180 [Flavobacteriales bacterium]|nr:hypothetical protein [Flavobacteriales bacterium]
MRAQESNAERMHRLMSERLLGQYFSKDDTDFQATVAPEKWNNESAVILSQAIYKFYNIKDVESGMRRRILLLDKPAVETFSEFYFDPMQVVGIRIIKKNGETLEPELSKAVDVNTGIPNFFTTGKTITYKKLAIPGMETGDIIDYFESEEETVEHNEINYLEAYSYSPVITTLATSYPIIKQKIIFALGAHVYMNFNSYKGAPKLKEVSQEMRTNLGFSSSERVYMLKDGAREKLKDEFWDYDFLHEPHFKFQAYRITGAGAIMKAPYYFNATGAPKEFVTKEEICRVEDLLFKGYSRDLKVPIKQTRQYLFSKYGTRGGTYEYLNASYYYLRFQFMAAHFKSRYGDMAFDEVDNLVYAKDTRIADAILKIMKSKHTQLELVVALPRNLGSIDSVLLRDELKVFLRYKGNQFIYPFSNLSDFAHTDPSVEGADAYVLEYTKRHFVFKEKIRIPFTDVRDNYLNTYVEIEPSGDLTSAKVSRITEVAGNLKDKSSLLPLYNHEYLKEDFDKFLPSVYRSGLNHMLSAEEEDKHTEILKERQRVKMEEVKKELEKDFGDVASVDTLQIYQDGRWDANTKLKYEEVFTLNNLINRAGRNYVMDIGKMIGGQLELNDQDMDRKSDIHMNSARSYQNTIRLKIPEGYTAEGLDNLKYNVDNEAGAFIADAQMEGDTLVVTTDKQYKKADVPVEQWDLMKAFLEAAYEFTQKKIILRKNDA